MSTETVAMPSFNRQIAQSAAWMIPARLTVWGFGLIILACFLKPSNFGIVSLGMAPLLVAVSFATSVQQQRLRRAQTELKGTARIFVAFGGRSGNRCHFK